jgi:hypothetical protein
LPTILNLFLNKISINILAIISRVIGCDREGAFLSDIQALLNYALAVLTTTVVFFIIILTLFIKSTVAV